MPRKLGCCIGWRCCPDVHPGVALAPETRGRVPAQERSADSPSRLGLQCSIHGVCAWCSVIQTFSPLLSTSVFVSFLFLELIELGAGLSGALLPPARGCAGQEAKAARSGPAGTEEPPSPFGDPRASSYPQPSLRQGHSWAGSGQSARLGTSVLARVALKARGGGGGLRTNLSIPSRRLLSRPQAEAVEDTGLA